MESDVMIKVLLVCLSSAGLALKFSLFQDENWMRLNLKLCTPNNMYRLFFFFSEVLKWRNLVVIFSDLLHISMNFKLKLLFMPWLDGSHAIVNLLFNSFYFVLVMSLNFSLPLKWNIISLHYQTWGLNSQQPCKQICLAKTYPPGHTVP